MFYSSLPEVATPAEGTALHLVLRLLLLANLTKSAGFQQLDDLDAAHPLDLLLDRAFMNAVLLPVFLCLVLSARNSNLSSRYKTAPSAGPTLLVRQNALCRVFRRNNADAAHPLALFLK